MRCRWVLQRVYINCTRTGKTAGECIVLVLYKKGFSRLSPLVWLCCPVSLLWLRKGGQTGLLWLRKDAQPHIIVGRMSRAVVGVWLHSSSCAGWQQLVAALALLT
jgi:hypothetical protein